METTTLMRSDRFRDSWQRLKDARARGTGEYEEYVAMHGLLRAIGLSRSESLKVLKQGLNLDILERSAHTPEPDSDSEDDFVPTEHDPTPLLSHTLPASATLPADSLLARAAVENIAELSGRVFILSGEMSSAEATTALIGKGLAQAPVFDPAAGGFLGFFRVCDVTHVLCQLAERGGMDMASISLETLLAGKGVSTLKGIVNPTRNGFVAVGTADPVTTLVQHVIDGARQVVVFSSDSENRHPVQVITEGMLIAFLEAHADELGAVAERKVGSVEPWLRMPEVVTVDETFLDALQAMVRGRHSSVPVIDADGRYVTCVRVTDITLPIRLDNFNVLFRDVYEINEQCLAHSDESWLRPDVTCSREATVQDVLAKMHAVGSHQLFVVDADGKLEGVISLRDVLQFLVTSEAPMQATM